MSKREEKRAVCLALELCEKRQGWVTWYWVEGGNRGTDMHDLIRLLGLGRGRPGRPHIDVDIVYVHVPSKSREMRTR